MDVKINRISNFLYSFRLSSNAGIRHVAKALTFINPDTFAKRRKIEKFDKRKLTFRIGMLPTLEKYLRENALGYIIEDYDYTLPEGTEIDGRMQGRYIHQRRAVEAFFRRRFGIIVVPTRGGKTFIASEICRIFLRSEPGKFLFLTDNTTLFDQAVGDLKNFFEPYGGLEVGEIRAGKIDTSCRVTVGMIQTIQSTLSGRCRDAKKKRDMRKYLKELQFLTVDEIHDNCSDSKLKIYKMCTALDYQLCLSATPYRSGAVVQNLKLMEWSGDVVYTITEKILRKRKVLSDYRVYMLLVNHNALEYEIENDEYAVYTREMIHRSEYRNRILCQTTEILRSLNLKTLLLFQSVAHGRSMEKTLGVPFISGSNSAQERAEAMTKFLKGKGGALSASGIFKKGVTLPAAEVLINVDGGLEDANTIQRKGRVLGMAEGKKKSLIIDFFDEFNAYLTDHSFSRLSTYVKAIGEKNVIVLDTSETDCMEALERYIKKWFEIV